MRLISLERAKAGDILAQRIFGVDGCLLLREGVALNNKYINKLIDLGIVYVYIEDGNLEDIKPLDPEFLEVKTEAIKSLSKVFSKIQHTGSVDIKNTLSAITDIVEYLIENKEINSTYLLELKTFDNYTYIHSLNTCVLSLFYGVQMSYSKPMLMDLGAGALLHDIGKTKIPVEIINKNGKLTDNEYDIMKTHPELGYEMVKNIDYINERGKTIVLEHHERIDGRGYPFGLKGDKISKYGRIACISDVYDAIVSDRVYRKGFAANEAYEFILANGGTFFDIELVNIFRNNFSLYPLGACVRLSNGIEGFVVGHNKGFPDRPTVRILYDEKGRKISPYEINLVETIDIGIESLVI
ncbi:HD-GYP domain, c-di-GMP phosphodiesterase class II (or its inactivated variant) [Caloramator quimbayensis]|uniref:HD-GYP domain, c-di-GMP phosphodiesterase class II (Or its inactivated variant) n=1 Tax=Caloramator quimbayensis TaxID=1147123 RepID=A0A1T4XMX7_9CLOT|nr:HD-GYP domain-containing protein [Caloramator quimbayensis]SKA90445.1 HD-GYP domain, c-di-GMP phosphodiesterase class II (or its inactivated variant) [Caloramator quimbayensis]